MTDTTHPPDEIVGSVRNVQGYLRRRYEATGVEILSRPAGEVPNAPGVSPSQFSRLTAQLIWEKGDLPSGDGDAEAVLEHLAYIQSVMQDVTEDFPDADVSSKITRDFAELTLTFEDEEGA